MPELEKTYSGGDFNRLLRALIERSVWHRAAALPLAVAILGLGVWSAHRLPLDVTPDISNVQVQILTSVPDLSPEEIEKAITRPLELEMYGLPHLEEIRSLTRFGISQMRLIFADGTDLFLARQMVSERLAQAADKLPAGLAPKLAPPSSGLGEVFTYALTFKGGAATNVSKAGLRRLKLANEFLVKPCLKSVQGVAEVNTTGGYDQQMVVAVDPTQLNTFGLDLNDLATIIQRNAAIGGGALIERDGTQLVIRSASRAQLTNDFSNLCIRLSLAAETIPLSRVATVSIASGVRLGAATLNGEEAVLGTAMMLAGDNARKWRSPSVRRSPKPGSGCRRTWNSNPSMTGPSWWTGSLTRCGRTCCWPPPWSSRYCFSFCGTGGRRSLSPPFCSSRLRSASPGWPPSASWAA